MGNCCSDPSEQTAPGAFKGEGHRLGAANEVTPLAKGDGGGGNAKKNDETIPAARHDPKLTDDEREKQRLERVAAAEARLKKMGGGQPKKKKETKGAPLNGPNSEPLMRWTAG